LAKDTALTEAIIHLSNQYGRYGHRMITALLCAEDGFVNHKRVERTWRCEGLKIPKKQPKRRRLWMDDDSCIRLRPYWKNRVLAYYFVMARTYDSKAF